MPQLLYPWERYPGSHCIGGWVGHRAGMDRYRKSRPIGIQSPDHPARSESHYQLCYFGPFPWVWGLSSSCDNLSVLRNVNYERDVSVAGLRSKWPNSRLSCSFSIQMDTIKNSGKPKTTWDLGMSLLNSNLLGSYIISQLSLVTFHHYSTTCGQLDEWVMLIQSNVTASGKLQLSDKTMTLQNSTVTSAHKVRKKEIPYFIREILSISLTLKAKGV